MGFRRKCLYAKSENADLIRNRSGVLLAFGQAMVSAVAAAERLDQLLLVADHASTQDQS